jgi:hypothetical protein
LLIQEETKKKNGWVVAMMTSNKMMKETPKRNGTVIHDDPRIGIGINTLPEPGGFKQTVKFNEGYPLEVAVLTSTATYRMFGHDDDRATSAQHRKLVQKDVFMKEWAKSGRKRSRNNYFLII